MLYTNIVNDLTAWIENNKFHNLKIEEIVEKSGFSRTHLQRLFKQKSSMSLGTYSRLRRLSAAAISLRITKNSVADLARSFGFDSPATFISAFRQQFGMTPGAFRDHDEWSFENMIPRFDYISKANELECKVVRFPAYKPFMVTSDLDELIMNTARSSECFVLIGGSQQREDFLSNSEVKLYYALGHPDEVEGQIMDWILIKTSEQVENLKNLQNLLYAGLLPLLGITRPKSCDIMKIRKGEDGLDYITEYLIPCVQKKNKTLA